MGEKILIFSSAFGEGHQQAAYALAEAARLSKQNIETIIFDFIAWSHPKLFPISHYMYMKGVKKFPNLYGYLFQKTKGQDPSRLQLNSLLTEELNRMQQLLKEMEPTVVVSTFPYTSFLISKLKEYGLTTVPSITVVTDYTDHGYWIHPYTDQYIVGSEQVRQALQKRGVAEYKIADTGIPVRTEFTSNCSKKGLLDKYGLDPSLPTILLMGGGYGLMGDASSVFHMLSSIPQKLQLFIVCGHNAKLKNLAKEQFKGSHHHICVTGYIDYVHELMAIANFLITKPGGVTISEAMAMGLPMLLYQALPGQEQDNADFLVNAGVAMKAESTEELRLNIMEVIESPITYLTLKKKVEPYNRKQSAVDALSVILNVGQRGKAPVSTWM